MEKAEKFLKYSFKGFLKKAPKDNFLKQSLEESIAGFLMKSSKKFPNKLSKEFLKKSLEKCINVMAF